MTDREPHERSLEKANLLKHNKRKWVQLDVQNQELTALCGFLLVGVPGENGSVGLLAPSAWAIPRHPCNM